ncbi:MAG: uracil-DNA glycosylase, partial [Gammaproteobacteria bacterium]|nr:uracil-DNA glycosylase [Gammaproteobacteria bacterium]
MEPESTEHELTELRASLRAMVEYHRAMGMKELLCPKGEGLAPLEPLPQRTPVVSQDHSSEALSPKAAAARLPARDTAEVREPASRRRSPPAAATLPAVDPAQALAAVERELEGCIRCRLSQGRNNIVFGAGSPTARLAFVGEGPGRDEDLQGIPFVGAAGQLLDKIIEAMGLDRDQVFICNVVKCRPPDNR